MKDEIKHIAGTIWEAKRHPLFVLGVILIGAGIALASYSVARGAAAAEARTAAALEEITPKAEQQKPIKDLIAEKARIAQGYDDKIDGALRMLMAQIEDPKTGKPGLDSKEWSPQSDGNGGVKFISTKRPAVVSAAPQTTTPVQPEK